MSISNHSKDVEISGRVLEYAANALMEDFANGSHRGHDATTLEVLEPPNLKGTRLTIYHDEPVPEHSPWRVASTMVRFTIDQDLLENGVQIFSGAARNVRTSEAATSEEQL